MEQGITIKAKLLNVSNTDSKDFDYTLNQFVKACNFVSDYYFNHYFIGNACDLQKDLYSTIRSTFKLKSQMAISCIRTVIARYKTVGTQLENKPKYYPTGKYNKQGKEIYLRVDRDLNWLQKPIQFKTPQIDLQRNRDWSFIGSDVLSINTLAGRKRLKFVVNDYFNKYLRNPNNYKLGTLKVIKKNRKYYAYITATTTYNDVPNEDFEHVVGIDRGLRFIATSYDEKGKVGFYSGKHVMRVRNKYARIRAQLQRKGTKSAKRALKRISGRENRFMSDVNHQITKTLLRQYNQNTLFVLEDLTGVQFAADNSSKKRKTDNHTWAFYQFEQDLMYKANLIHSKVIKVPANYTSQRCPKCGQINSDNRNHHLHLYVCDKCGYKSNDDRIAGMNIQFLGTLYRSGNPNPRFVKTNK